MAIKHLIDALATSLGPSLRCSVEATQHPEKFSVTKRDSV